MDQVDQVKSKVDIVSLINDYVSLKKSGRNYQALCPFHDEKTPSFMVSPELQIYKCFGCFPPGSLIKTSKGLRPIETIKRGDSVYSHKGRVRKVLLTFERPYFGSLTSIKLRKLGSSVTLTDDHKVFVLRGAPYLHKKFKNLSRRIRHDRKKYDRETFLNKFEKYFSIKKIKAGDLTKNDYLLHPVVEKVRDVSFLPLKYYIDKKHPPHGTKPRKIDYNIPVNDNFLKLLGYYIAEGSSNRAYIRFSLGLHENEFSEDIKGIISDLFKLKVGVHKRKRKLGSGLEVTCCHSLLADAFSNMCGSGASNKHIPYIFNFLPLKKQKILLEAIQRGDGHQFRSSRGGKLFNAISTTSPTLKDQIKDILLRLGYFPTVTIKKPRIDENGVNHQKAYVVKWSDETESRYKLTIRTRDNSLFWVLPIYDLKKQTYEGKVFNLNVKGDHSYVTESFAVGNCGAGGDAIKFVEEYEKVDFWEALEILAKRVGVKLERKGLGKAQEKKKRLYEINHLAANFYHFILTEREEGKKAREYLLDRGIEEETIKKFKLGFSPSHQNAVIKFLKKRGYDNQEIRQTGLTAKGKRGDYERFYSRLVFPLYNHRGNIVGFSGRVVPGISSENIAKYVNIPNTPLYKKGQNLYGLWMSKNEIRDEKEAVIVEGEFDLISPYQEGITNIVAIKGTAFTPEQAKLLKRYAETAVFALDADAAGSEAVKRSSSIAEEIDLEIKVAILPKGYKDPDDLAQDKPELLREVINKAVSVYDFVIQNALNNYQSDQPSDQRKILKEVLPFLNQIENAVVKQHYLKQIADEMKVSLESVIVEANKAEVSKSPKLKSTQQEVGKNRTKKDRRLLLEEELISLIFSSRLWDYLHKEVVIDLISHPRLAKILVQAQQYLEEKEAMDIKAFFETLPEELKPGFENIYFLVKEDTSFDEDDVQETIQELSREDCRQKLTEISNQLTDEEKKGNEEKVEQLEQKYVQISKKLSNLEKND